MSADDEEGDIEKVRGRDEHKHTPQFFLTVFYRILVFTKRLLFQVTGDV